MRFVSLLHTFSLDWASTWEVQGRSCPGVHWPGLSGACVR